MSKYTNILCPTDFSAHAEAALRHAEELARDHEANLIVLHVVEPMVMPVAAGAPRLSLIEFERGASESARRYLEPVIDGLRARGVRARSLVTSGPAAERIVQLATSERADLVVMGADGYRGLGYALLGSTADRTVRTCPCPVLTVRVSPRGIVSAEHARDIREARPAPPHPAGRAGGGRARPDTRRPSRS